MPERKIKYSEYPVHPEVLQPGEINVYFADFDHPTCEDVTDGCSICLVDDKRYIKAVDYQKFEIRGEDYR